MTKTLPSWLKIKSSSCMPDFATSTFHTMSGKRIRQSKLNGDRWVGHMTTPLLSPAQHRELSAFLNALVDSDDSFYAYNPDHRLPTGAASGAGVIDGAGQLGSLPNTKGWPVSTILFEPGDYVQIGTGFHEVTAQVSSGLTGLATLPILPSIKVAPTNLAPVIYTNPVCIAEITSNLKFDTDHSKGGVISFSWEEKL